jgi:hypothetical protein
VPIPRGQIRQDVGMSGPWSCQHFSLGNPRKDGASDLPRLLRRFADEIEIRQIKAMDILDLTVSQEMTEDGPWWSTSLYWSPDNGSGSEQ